MTDMEVKVTVGIAGLLLAVLLWWILRRFLWRRRRRSDIFEDMEGREFEYFCAELLEQSGLMVAGVLDSSMKEEPKEDSERIYMIAKKREDIDEQ